MPENSYFIHNNASLLALSYPEEEINRKLGVSLEEYNKRNEEVLKILKDVEQEYEFVKLLDPTPFLLNGEKNGFIVVKGGKSLYFDNNHLSNDGAALLKPLFESTPIFQNMH